MTYWDDEFRGTVGTTFAESEPFWPTRPSAPTEAPNVVYVVLDDVGFADLGCFGGEIETTNMDHLAQQGVRFTNFHTTALCSPTRASLLTGRNHHSVGMGVVANWDTGFPGYRGRITRRAATLAEMLRPNGYSTYAVGKWHLVPTDEMTAAGPMDHWPLQRGFDRFYGFLDGGTDHWSPDLVEDNRPVDPPRTPDYHLSTDLADHAVSMIREHRSVYPEKPFFLYFCFGPGHYPLHAPRASLAKYRGRYDEGWDAIRDERLARQLALGIAPEGTELAPRNDDVRPWNELSADEQLVAARLMEAYAGFLDHADAQLGHVLDALEATGAAANTIVVLLSDNGASGEGGPYGSLNYMAKTNGVPTPPVEELLAQLDAIGGPTTSPQYPTGWAMASNTPLKRYKGTTHAGGVRDPLIVCWPAGLGDHAGAVRPQYHHVSDITPTMLELLGIDAPATVAGIEQMPIEGTSMSSTLQSASAPSPKVAQYFEMYGRRAIWHDGWKAVSFHAKGDDYADDVWELYDTEHDFAEVRDLATAEPERLAALVERWWDEARAHHVLPLDDRSVERFLTPKPKPITERSRFVYYPGVRVPSYGAPDVRDVSYTITVRVDCTGIDVASGAADGVLVCLGDRFCGYSLFVHDGALVHDYNCAGNHYVARTTAQLPAGPCELRYTFTKTGRLQGEGTVTIDGAAAGSVDVARTLSTHLSPAPLTVGRGPLSPVSPLYEAPFLFGGVLHQVVFELGDDRAGVPTSPYLD
jgi:arylsulfatase A-like enzyme